MYDYNNLVRQNAIIGISFVIMQCNEHLVTDYKRIITNINKIIIDRSEDQCVKYGAMIGRGISESGGRNIIFSIFNQTGNIDNTRVMSVLLFMNYWYWYPNLMFLSLCSLPTVYLKLNKNLEVIENSLVYVKNYDNYIYKVPEFKKSRKFKKNVVEQDIVVKCCNKVESGQRCTLIQMGEVGVEFPCVYFDGE